MTSQEQRLLSALAWMCAQYLEDRDGELDHLSMSAGERAVALLVDYGLIAPSGRGGTWTAEGQALLDRID
ncbi:hypothetical protein DDF62_14280 [Caulobacter radicis]|uniref:hypothetical protein n=1 Tax=Caulobacter radicis TaxID=2172650 RepID=UPI000D57308C|nr:hypothetical protein [Caulobacter radicis]PVM88690.1 hypothetical protein DDF62_14280 [Caulobacter radicis]